MLLLLLLLLLLTIHCRCRGHCCAQKLQHGIIASSPAAGIACDGAVICSCLSTGVAMAQNHSNTFL
jgi:hypothetical protein